MRSRRLRAVLSVLASAPLLSGGGWVRAQEAGAEPFFETIDVRLANLEVLVTDRAGRPVHGLGPADFEVTEDGVPVEITHFSAIQERRSVATAVGGPGELADSGPTTDSTSPGATTRHLNLVVYVDDFNLQPKTRNQTLASLRTFLDEELDPRDRVMIVHFDGNLRVLQPFTGDTLAAREVVSSLETGAGRHVETVANRRRLLRDLQTAPLTPRPPPNALEQANFEAAILRAEALMREIEEQIRDEARRLKITLEGLDQFVASLAGLPGRKAFLYVSDGLPERVGEALVQAFDNKYGQWIQLNQVTSMRGATLRLRSSIEPIGAQLRNLIEQAAAHRVAFYPISAGLPTSGAMGSAELTGSDTSTGAGAFSSDVATVENFNREAPLLALADGTGGVAYTGSTNLAGLLEQVVDDFTSFYSLGYTPPDPVSDDFQRVEVRVRGRDDLRVRHVRGYREIDPLEELRNLTLSALHYDFQDNPLGVEIVLGQNRETAGGGYRVPLLIKIPFKNLALLPRDGFFEGKVVAYVVVQDETGGTSPFQRIVLPIQIPAERYELALEAEAGYQVDLAMRRGRHRVSVGVRDLVTDLQATLNREVVVGRGSR